MSFTSRFYLDRELHQALPGNGSFLPSQQRAAQRLHWHAEESLRILGQWAEEPRRSRQRELVWNVDRMLDLDQPDPEPNSWTPWVASGNSLSFGFTFPSVKLGILASDLSCSTAARKNQARTIKHSLFNYQHSVAENSGAAVSDQKETHLCRIKIFSSEIKQRPGGG